MSRCPSTRLSSPPAASSPPSRAAASASLGTRFARRVLFPTGREPPQGAVTQVFSSSQVPYATPEQIVPNAATKLNRISPDDRREEPPKAVATGVQIRRAPSINQLCPMLFVHASAQKSPKGLLRAVSAWRFRNSALLASISSKVTGAKSLTSTPALSMRPRRIMSGQ